MTAAANLTDQVVTRADASWLARQRIRWDMSFGRTPITATEMELIQRRIYLLPTIRGIAVILIALLLLLLGINYQLSLAYVVAFLLAGLMQVALLTSYRNLSGLIVRSGRSPRCTAGETLAFPVTLASPERAREGIKLTTMTDKRAITSGRLFVAADTNRAVALTFSATRRGALPLRRIVVESCAPYGLVRAWSYVHFEWVGWVEPVAETPPPALPFAAGDETGAAQTAHVAHDPDSLREYVQGDSLKRVAWKQVAKSGNWYTRTGDAGERQEIELTWQATNLADNEERLSRMAAWLTRAHNENCAYSLTMPNGQLALADGARQYADALQMLALFPQRVDDVRGLR